MLDKKNRQITPHENVASEIVACFNETEQDILNHKIIRAYYNLQKTNKMIAALQEFSTQKVEFKERQMLLNNKLNNQILKFIDDEGNYNGL